VFKKFKVIYVTYSKLQQEELTDKQKLQLIKDILLKVFEFIIFLILGFPTMLLTFMADCWYFWVDNFRAEEDLKKIVIEKDPSTINKNSIIKIKMLCEKYSYNRCKAIYTIDYVKRMREERDINSLLQFLVFGQFINKK
tara:strand:- start:233 stop:649 length:417 start_codon:yes stop_codon:yes gene_type:complete